MKKPADTATTNTFGPGVVLPTTPKTRNRTPKSEIVLKAEQALKEARIIAKLEKPINELSVDALKGLQASIALKITAATGAV